MERDGLLHVLVPVGPVVVAGELLVLVRDVQRLQVLWNARFCSIRKSSVPQSIRKAGIRPWSIFSTMRERDPRARPCRRLPKIRSNSRAMSLILSSSPVVLEEAEGPGVGIDAGEHLVVLQPELDRAVAAHREPADGPAGALGLDGEGPVDQADDVLDQVVLVGVAHAALVYQPRPPSGMTTTSGRPST